MYNIILDDKARLEYDEVIKELELISPEIMNRKSSRANVQQAFCFQTIRELVTKDQDILCVGSFEDTAFEALKRNGYQCIGIDPAGGGKKITLEEFAQSDQQFDCSFACSVIEHVVDHMNFIDIMCKTIKPKGLMILTCDYKESYIVGDPNNPTTSFRMYNNDTLSEIRKLLSNNNLELVDEPNWKGEMDFTWEGHWYAFATIVARKYE